MAQDLSELQAEIDRLLQVNPEAFTYHLREGHIANWLDYIGETELAEQLRGVENIDEVRLKLKSRIEQSDKQASNAMPYHKARPKKR